MLLTIALSLISLVSAPDDKALGEVFRTHNASGTIVIRSFKRGTTYTWNQERSAKRFPAASTFKIFNTLIALDEGVFDLANEQFIWDGTRYEIEGWNQNLSMSVAFKISCVWCYQKLAERIGAKKYESHIKRAEYGALTSPFQTTTFWLDGSLSVSALEQVMFLRKVHSRSLSYRKSSYDGLKEIMKTDSPTGAQLYAKTGWTDRTKPGIGWYVGYVDTGSDVWLFAMNMDVDDPGQLELRRKIILSALESKGIIRGSAE